MRYRCIIKVSLSHSLSFSLILSPVLFIGYIAREKGEKRAGLSANPISMERESARAAEDQVHIAMSNACVCVCVTPTRKREWERGTRRWYLRTVKRCLQLRQWISVGKWEREKMAVNIPGFLRHARASRQLGSPRISVFAPSSLSFSLPPRAPPSFRGSLFICSSLNFASPPLSLSFARVRLFSSLAVTALMLGLSIVPENVEFNSDCVIYNEI